MKLYLMISREYFKAPESEIHADCRFRTLTHDSFEIELTKKLNMSPAFEFVWVH